MKNCGIYQIRNIKNNRIYVGSSKDLKRRNWKHFNQLRNNKHDNPFLQRDFNKCGEKYFKFMILEYCLECELKDIEQDYINILWDNKKECYNLSKDSECFFRGIKFTEEHKQKISQAHKGRKFTKEHRENLSKEKKRKPNKLKGKKRPEISGVNHPMFGKTGANKGKKFTEEHKEKLSIKAKNRWEDGIIYHFIHESGAEEKLTKIQLKEKYKLSSHVNSIVKGKRKSHKGWRIKQWQKYNQ